MVALAGLPTAARSGTGSGPKTGLNTEQLQLSRWILFNDVMHTAVLQDASPLSMWASRNAATLALETVDFPLDANGYPSVAMPYDPDGGGSAPSVIARARLLAGNVYAPAGAYTLHFTGTGTVRVSGDAATKSCTGTNPTCSVTVTPTGLGVNVDIVSSTGPIPSISLRVPGANGTFYQPTLDQLQGVRAIRSMNVTRVNHYPCSNGAAPDSVGCVQTWADRQPATAIQSTRRGLAWEHFFALCNAVHADCWVNIPHAAEDAYVTALAQLAQATLHPGLRYIVERSNELWNGGFEQSQYYTALGNATQTGNNAVERRRKAIVVDVARTMKLTRDAFADDARVYAVLGSFAFDGGSESSGLLGYWADPTYNPTGQTLDALAIAPYFGGSTWDRYEACAGAGCPSSQTIIAEAKTDMEAFLPPYLAPQAAIAHGAGLDLVAYEGGTLIYGSQSNPPLQALVDDAVFLPGAKDLIDAYYALWDSYGGGLFMHFGWVHAESAFGQMLIPNATDAPKTPMWDAFRARIAAPEPATSLASLVALASLACCRRKQLGARRSIRRIA